MNLPHFETWELGVLGIHDYRSPSKFAPWFDFLREHHASIEGDVAEFGVFRGSSLLATALLLTELGSDKLVWGFDSFRGFPTYHENDAPERFEDLLAAGAISEAHFDKVVRNRRHLEVVGRSADAAKASASGDFGGTSQDHVERLAAHLGLTNIRLVAGPFEATLLPTELPDLRLCAALLDCDLYDSHARAMPFAWDRLVPGGFVFLDEYFSLKFPGARIAVDEFLAAGDVAPHRLPGADDGFERWGVTKPEAAPR